MDYLLDINTFYKVTAILMYLGSKAYIARVIWKKVTVRKRRNLLLTLTILFSPSLATVSWFFHLFDASFYACGMPAIALAVDLGIVQWIRAIFEPRHTLDDLEYDPDLTNW